MFSPLNLTCDAFSEGLSQHLGRGKQHAALLYQEWFRTGQVTGQDPAFNTARVLLEEMRGLLDLETLELITEKSDGMTGKVLFRTTDRLEVESVLIPMRAGGTLCVSSQVGCKMGCTFCETGRMGLLRNLTCAEIVSQVFLAKHLLNFPLRNVVFMGMGEPFDNYDNVMQAVKVLMDPMGLGLGAHRITVSTSGCVPEIDRFTAEGLRGPNLAVSLTAPTDELRNRLMPINRKHDLNALYQAMMRYQEATKREILVAYVLLQGVNDQISHAEELVSYLKGLNVKINLIPYNPQSRDRFQAPTEEVQQAFVVHLRKLGHAPLLRRTKGDRIMAACGQLGNLALRKEWKMSQPQPHLISINDCQI